MYGEAYSRRSVSGRQRRGATNGVKSAIINCIANVMPIILLSSPTTKYGWSPTKVQNVTIRHYKVKNGRTEDGQQQNKLNRVFKLNFRLLG